MVSKRLKEIGAQYPELKTPEQQERLDAELDVRRRKTSNEVGHVKRFTLFCHVEHQRTCPSRHPLCPRWASNTVPLCEQCHGRVHNKTFTTSALTRAAMM